MLLVNMLKSIILKDESENKVTTSDIGGNKRGLDTFSVASVRGENMIINNFVYDQILTQGAYTTIFSTTGSGKLIETVFMCDTNEIVLRLIRDGNIFLQIDILNDIFDKLKLRLEDYSFPPLTLMTYNNGNGVVFKPPSPVNYDSNFSIQLLSTKSGKKCLRGYSGISINA